jgi:hypothetical protein
LASPSSVVWAKLVRAKKKKDARVASRFMGTKVRFIRI